MKFYPPSKEPVQVALTTGHIAIVEDCGTDLAPMFQREAIACGCLPEGIERETPVVQEAFDKTTEIINGCIKMIEDGIESEFTGDGRPKTDVLSKRVGFTVSSSERDAAWEVASDEGAAAPTEITDADA